MLPDFTYQSPRGSFNVIITRTGKSLELKIIDIDIPRMFEAMNSQTYSDAVEITKCPNCAAEIEATTVQCIHCRKWVAGSPPPLLMWTGSRAGAAVIRDPDDRTVKKTILSLAHSTNDAHTSVTIEFEGCDDYLMIHADGAGAFIVHYNDIERERAYERGGILIETVMSLVQAYRRGDIDNAEWHGATRQPPALMSRLLLEMEDGQVVNNPDIDAFRKAIDALQDYNAVLRFSHSLRVKREDGRETLTVTKNSSNRYDIHYHREADYDYHGTESQPEVEYDREDISQEGALSIFEAYRKGEIDQACWHDIVPSQPRRPSQAQASRPATPAQVAYQEPPASGLTPQEVAGYQAQSCIGVMQMGFGCMGIIIFGLILWFFFSTAL